MADGGAGTIFGQPMVLMGKLVIKTETFLSYIINIIRKTSG